METADAAAAPAEGQGGAPPPPPPHADGHHADAAHHDLVDDAVDSALAAHALMGSNNTAHRPHHSHAAGDPAHAGSTAAHAGAYGPSAYESGGFNYGGHPPSHAQPHGYGAHYPYQPRYYGPSPRSQQQQQQATAFDYDKPYPSPTNYHYQGAPYDYDIPPGSHHQGYMYGQYGPPPNAYQPHAYHNHNHQGQSQSQQPPPTTGPVPGGSGPSPPSGYEYPPYYAADESQQPHDHHQRRQQQQQQHYAYSTMYGPPPAPRGMTPGTAHVEDFRQVTPRTSDMDDGASASTSNTGARSIEAAAAAGAGVGGRKGTDNSSSPTTNKGTYSAAKTPAASNAGTAMGSKKDKSPEEMTAAEALITTAGQRYVHPPSGHPGPFYTPYYPHGGVPLPPPHGPYNSALPPPPHPHPHTPGANILVAGAGVSQPVPSNRDLPAPSAVAAAVVAASKEIAAGGRSTVTASPDKASRPDLSAANNAMTTPARKQATEGEDDVVGALLEMKTSSAEKKEQQQMQISPSSLSGAGGDTIESAACVPTIDPAEWARQLPLRLSTPNDEIHLNRLHCFIRSTLLELFVIPVGKSTDGNLQGRQYQAGEIRYHSVALAHRRPQPPHAHPPPPNWHRRFPIPPGPPPHGLPPPPPPPPSAHIMAPQAPLAQGQQKTASTASGSAPAKGSTPIPPGPPVGNTATAAKKMPPPSSSLRVGMGCVFCARAQREQAKRVAQRGGKAPPLRGTAPMSTFYPRNLAEIYNLVSRFQRLHFKECKFVPPTIRKQFNDHKENDKSRGRREYWVKSAKAIGLVDDKNGRGIRFVPPNAFEQSDSTSTGKPSSNTVVDGGGVGGSGGNASRAEPSCPTTAGSDANSVPEAKAATGGAEAKAAGETVDVVPV